MNLSRSPYIFEVDDATQTGSKIELYLWNTGSQPASPQYTLSKLIPASNNTNFLQYKSLRKRILHF